MLFIIQTFLNWIYHRHLKVGIILALSAGVGAYGYSSIRDNQSIYEMLNMNNPSNRYYIQHYSPEFGKDDFVYIAFEAPDILGDRAFQVIGEVHQILSQIKIKFDISTGQILWATDPERPFSETLRHALQPSHLKISWSGNHGILLPSPAEVRKKMDQQSPPIEVEKEEMDGGTVGLIPAIRFVFSLKNGFVKDPQRIAPISIEDALMLRHEPGELSQQDIEKLLLENPATGSLLLSNMEKFDTTTGNETRGEKPRYTMMLAQMVDFRDHDDLRQAFVAELRHQLAPLEKNTGITFHLAGIPVLNAETTRNVSNDHFRREPFVLVIIAMMLLVIFGGDKRYLLLPFVIILFTLLTTLGLFKLFGGEFNWLTALLPVFLIVCSLSNTIHILQHYQKELHSEMSWVARLQDTVVHVWKPCLLTSLTTIIGFLSLTFWKESLWAMKMFGFFGSIGLIISLLAAFVGFALFIRFLPPPSAKTKNEFSERRWNSFLNWLFGFCKRRAYWIVLATIVITIISIQGITKIEASVDVKHYFKNHTPIAKALDFIDDHFRGLGTYAVVFEENSPSQIEAILLSIPGQSDSKPLTIRLGAQSLEAIKKTVACYRRFESASPQKDSLTCDWEHFELPSRKGRLTGSALSILDFIPEGLNATDPQKVLDRLVAVGEQSAIANQMIRFLFSKDGTKTQVVRLAHAESSAPIKLVNDRIIKDLDTFCQPQTTGTPNCEAHFTGIGQVWNQFTQKLTIFLAKSFGAASLGVFIVMIFCFLPRMDLGVLSLLPNILPNIFILGAMGFMHIPLDMVTAMVGSIALGMIVDDTIHFLHRFQGELKASNNFDQAVHKTVLACGKAVIMTSLILAAGFSVLTVGNFVPVINVGKLLMIIILCGVSFEVVLMPALLFAVYKPLWRFFYEKNKHPHLASDFDGSLNG